MEVWTGEGGHCLPVVGREPPHYQNSGDQITSTPSVLITAGDAATLSLLAIQTQSHAYQMLVQRRPKYKFTGDHKKIDFDAFMYNCENLLKIPGATEEMQLAELPYWFSGTAGLITDRYLGSQDAPQALKNAFRALKKEFGKKRQTAKQLLTDALTGNKLPPKEPLLRNPPARHQEKNPS